MAATMARQGGRVQPEQSDMRLALNVAKMAKGRCSRATIVETQHLIKRPRAEVWEEKKRGVEFAGHRRVKAAIEQHPAMVYENHSDGCLPCQNGTAKNPRTRCRPRCKAAPPLVWRKQPTPAVKPPPPRTPPAPSGDNNHAKCLKIQNRPAGYEYRHAPLPSTQFFNHDLYAKDSEHNEDFIPDLRNDERTSTG